MENMFWIGFLGAAVVGDPFKDTSGPSLNILIKLCSTVSIVFSGLILVFNLMNFI